MPAVQSAFDAIANAARNSLSNARAAAPASPFQDAGTAVGDALRAVGGFASGTPDAPPGWAWVGEEGPELMRLRGGEPILPAAVSAKVAGLSGYASGSGGGASSLAMGDATGSELMHTEPTAPEPLYALDGGGSGGNIVLNLTYAPGGCTIGSVSNAEDLRAVVKSWMAEHQEEAVEFIMDALADHERSAALGAYR